MAFIAILLLLFIGSVCPEQICELLLPVDTPPETSPPPYKIDVFPKVFEPGSLVQVELNGYFNSSFNGFLLEARRGEIGYGPQDEAIGEFEEILPPFDTELRDCGSGTENTWVHLNNVTKYTRIIRWVAPSTFEGPIVFSATVIQEYASTNGTAYHYWTNVESEPLNSISGNDLQCYECYYTETNGSPDPDRDDSNTCHRRPWDADVVTCADEISLSEGSVYRCYTSEWKQTSSNGDVVVGIRRGCIGVNAEEYYLKSSTSDIEDIQEIFDFTLAPGEQQTGTTDLCYYPRCNNHVAELQCYSCHYVETNGVSEFQYDPNKYNCLYDPYLVDFVTCGEDEDPLPAGYIHRCYTSVYRQTTRYGDYVQGIHRGCVAVNVGRYGNLLSTTNIDDIEEIFGFELLPGTTQHSTADLCDSDFCNDVSAEVECYQCTYTETNGVADPGRDDKEQCYYQPSSLDLVNCEEEGLLGAGLGVGEIYRCHTSQYYKRTLYGDIEEGIRRGCVAVKRSYYGTLYKTSDIDHIQDIFDFTLLDGDVQTGTSEFCDIDSCNDDEAGLQCHKCYNSQTNGVVDDDATTTRDVCLNYPSSTSLVNCVDDTPLQAGQIHRCYTSEWDRVNANGDVRIGIRRGCIAVDQSTYGDLPWTSNINYIQDIFGFQLGPGDRQTGTSDFCTWDECNNEYLYSPVWNAWGPYSDSCTQTCGGGTQTRYRTCNDPRPDDYYFCIGASSESIECNTEPCQPDEAYWSSWSAWSRCSATCGLDGTLTRTRLCIDPLAGPSDFFNSGRCGDYDTERRSCYAPPCPFQEWGQWTSWSSCNERCGGGQRSRRRNCNDVQIPYRCEGPSLDFQNCNTHDCDGDEEGVNTLVLVGIILGVVAGIVVAVLLSICCCLGLLRGPRVPRARPRPWYTRDVYYPSRR